MYALKSVEAGKFEIEEDYETLLKGFATS